MIYLNKGTAKLITNLAERAVNVANSDDDNIIEDIKAIQDIKKQIAEENSKVLRALGQAFVVFNAEKLRRGIKDTLDNQMSLFDYEEEPAKLK